MVCGLFDSGWNFGIDFLKIENERPPPARAFGGCVLSARNQFSPMLAILKYPVRNL